jgi:biotin transport system substrate-specific component
MQTTLSHPVPATLPFHRTLPGQVAFTLAGSLLVALCAHVTVPLPSTLVPLSLVTFGVLVVGLTLGPIAGFSALVLYLAEGASGLPVFSPHGPGGLFQLLGPTGGYLMSYPLAALTAGLLVTRTGSPRRRFFSAALACSVASIFFFAFGATWLAHWQHLTPYLALRLGVLPFLPGEAVKIAAASAIYASLRPRS